MGESSEPTLDPVLAADQSPAPTPEEQETMHVHKIKPVHGWGEFASEIIIIVIGVFIALAGEQAVEALHWRNEVVEAKDALRAELNHDLGGIYFKLDQQTCIDRRLQELEMWEASLRHGQPLTLTGPIAGPESWTMHSSVWEIVKAGQAAAHMSLPDKLAYANIYDDLQNVSNIAGRERDAWVQLNRIGARPKIDDNALGDISSDIEVIRKSGRNYATNIDDMSSALRRFGIKPDILKGHLPEVRRRLCGSILPSTQQ